MTTLYLFNKRGGKVIKTASSIAGGFIGLYALQNTTGERVSILVNADTNEILRVYIGRKDRTPHVSYNDKLGKLDYLERYIKDDTHINIDKLLEAYEG